MPPRKVQSSAATLIAWPIALAYPLIHAPFASLIKATPPTPLGFPKEDPSEFSLNQLTGGGNHLTWIVDFVGASWHFAPTKTYSVAFGVYYIYIYIYIYIYKIQQSITMAYFY